MLIEAGRLDCRYQAEEESGDHGGDHRDQQDASVNMDLVNSRQQGLRQYGDGRLGCPYGDQAPQNPTCQREQQAFCQELSNDAESTRSQCKASRNFFLPGRSSRE